MGRDTVRLVVNPRAGAGRAARAVPSIERAFARNGFRCEVARTEGPGDAGRLVRDAARDGVDLLTVVGGDGTLGEAMQGAFTETSEATPGLPTFAVVPAGTGGDFRRTLGLSLDVDETVDRIARAAPRPLDLGKLELTAHDGATRLHAFVNIASFGVSGVADELVNRAPKWLGGRLVFFWSSVRANFLYRNQAVRATVDGAVLHEGPMLLVAIANGRYFGSGMHMAPDASPWDGLLDVVCIGDISRARALGLGLTIYRGAHVRAPYTTLARGRVVEAVPLEPAARVLLDIDGETPGVLPLRATVLPGAVRVRA